MGLIPPLFIGKTGYPGRREWHIILSCEEARVPVCGTGRFVSGGLDVFTGGLPTCHKCIAAIRRSHNPRRLETYYRQSFSRCQGCHRVRDFSYRFDDKWLCEACWVTALVRSHCDAPERVASR